ncbi:RHS repeat-associated protein [Chryseobacterium sp. SORGH_AS909]|uniref:RHS repeat-associated protein n=2 Tax=Chryseobacterium group TaxID=2782232 RepID=A0ABU0TJF9_9FLAO|nr:RHS repeat-associated protein [Chryseobacterium camelliae]MDQ1101118.1 RHS repeat-associated protein [Chryseobacterium sp. SORGH_AS_1048]MDR6084561.1 RHS repeat-associated protein [Chryseobacterium sp. SORGH_AS_0909]MDR6132830.1 RHS repeat-associated protein [Chryseobacterium sp. SORGH_AS_1175]MDT3408962.1 RHS repeat-associated protein [Pseudacidovorax intermedius]
MHQERTVYSNPYKFNAKELDSETALYYYGARYYNPRLSIWYGVDPLAVYDPVMQSQFYGDGEHNGGVYNQGNLNPYIYCYQNPIKYIDPNGKQSLSYNIYGDNSETRSQVAGQYLELTKEINMIAAGLTDGFLTGGLGTRFMLAYEVGSAYHSMEMQSYWRSRGNETAAQKYEQEGAGATKNLVIWGALEGVGAIARKAFSQSLFDVLPTNMKFDKGAHELAKEIGGKAQARFRYSNREYDAISDTWIGQHKPGLTSSFGKSFRNQAKATFEDAKATGRGVYYKFDSKPAQEVINKLSEYSKRYNVKLEIKY